MTLRAIQTAEAIAAEPDWMASFLASLARDDLAPATLRGYRYDLRHFLAWHQSLQDGAFAIERLTEHDLIAYRQHMIAAGRRPASVNRRLEALRRLCRWARGTGVLTADAAGNVRPMRTTRNQQPVGLTDGEVHALCAPPAPPRTAWPPETMPWSNSCCRPDCASAKSPRWGWPTSP